MGLGVGDSDSRSWVSILFPTLPPFRNHQPERTNLTQTFSVTSGVIRSGGFGRARSIIFSDSPVVKRVILRMTPTNTADSVNVGWFRLGGALGGIVEVNPRVGAVLAVLVALVTKSTMLLEVSTPTFCIHASPSLPLQPTFMRVCPCEFAFSYHRPDRKKYMA